MCYLTKVNLLILLKIIIPREGGKYWNYGVKWPWNWQTKWKTGINISKLGNLKNIRIKFHQFTTWMWNALIVIKWHCSNKSDFKWYSFRFVQTHPVFDFSLIKSEENWLITLFRVFHTLAVFLNWPFGSFSSMFTHFLEFVLEISQGLQFVYFTHYQSLIFKIIKSFSWKLSILTRNLNYNF